MPSAAADVSASAESVEFKEEYEPERHEAFHSGELFTGCCIEEFPARVCFDYAMRRQHLKSADGQNGMLPRHPWTYCWKAESHDSVIHHINGSKSALFASASDFLLSSFTMERKYL